MPGSKSHTARALLVAALADGVSHLSNASPADDVRLFVEALRALGFTIDWDRAQQEIAVHGLGGRIPSRRGSVFVGNAGTAARFLTALLTLGEGMWELGGAPRMRERPIGALVDALTQLGATVKATDGYPPVHVTGSGLDGGAATVDGTASSQFISACLMVAPYARRPVELRLTNQAGSRPYVDLTIAVMRAYGVEVQREGYESFTVPQGRYRSPSTYAIEPDASAASYFFAAAATCGGTVTVRGMRRDALQGDVAFLDCLRDMGCTVTDTDAGLQILGASTLRGIDVDMADIPDTAQTLATIAPFAATPTRIRGIATARVKETDRIAAVCAELSRLGVHVEEHADGMTIHPCANLTSGTVRTYGDHRMAMAFALIGLRVPGMSIDDPSCVAKTFPDFFAVLETLR